MVLRLHELGEAFECLFTPTGNELPALLGHLDAVMTMVGKTMILPENKDLFYWMEFHQALPNWRMRWCTRQIKIEPCIAYLVKHPGSTLLVGLRADEEKREGLYGSYAQYRYPLREWGWGLQDVITYLNQRGVKVPARTDCALCYGQRLGEWYRLWRDYPQEYAKGEDWEARTGHTFRSAQRDSWPAGLAELRQLFEAGKLPRGATVQLTLDDSDDPQACRVCRF